MQKLNNEFYLSKNSAKGRGINLSSNSNMNNDLPENNSEINTSYLCVECYQSPTDWKWKDAVPGCRSPRAALLRPPPWAHLCGTQCPATSAALRASLGSRFCNAQNKANASGERRLPERHPSIYAGLNSGVRFMR